MTKYTIYVVEDDKVIAEQMQKYLEKWGYNVVCASDFQNIMTEFARVKPELVLMDVGLPFYNGYYWCAQIRQISQVPILFVSSASDNMNIIMAVNMGGDDFLSKPFEPDILAAKVQAVLRRTYTFRGQTSLLEYGGAVLNLAEAVLIAGENRIDLTKNEFRIMQLLFENGNQFVSREAIMKRLWDNECFADDNTLTVNMTRIRKKLEAAGMGNFIVTKKGIGYGLEERGEK